MTTPSYTSYIIGYVLSLALTLAAYFAATGGLSGGTLVAVVMLAALAQLAVQLVAFLHLGRDDRPHWNSVTFLYTALLVVILVGGSLWIMYHLDYNMMLMLPTEMDAHMMAQ